MKSVLKNFRMSPRKVRLIANFVKGFEVNKALSNLSYINKKASQPIFTLIKSAIANAKNNDAKEGNFYIKDIVVEEGKVLKRWRPASRGSAKPIRKRSSTIRIGLDIKK